MVRVRLTAHLQGVAGFRESEVEAARVRDLLDALGPRVRPYLLDEHGALREHVLVFVDSESVRDLLSPLRPDARVDILQAPAGG